MLPLLSSSRLLTMEYIDGVPLLDIAGMDLPVKQELMSALVRAQGLWGGIRRRLDRVGDL